MHVLLYTICAHILLHAMFCTIPMDILFDSVKHSEVPTVHLYVPGKSVFAGPDEIFGPAWGIICYPVKN